MWQLTREHELWYHGFNLRSGPPKCAGPTQVVRRTLLLPGGGRARNETNICEQATGVCGLSVQSSRGQAITRHRALTWSVCQHFAEGSGGRDNGGACTAARRGGDLETGGPDRMMTGKGSAAGGPPAARDLGAAERAATTIFTSNYTTNCPDRQAARLDLALDAVLDLETRAHDLACFFAAAMLQAAEQRDQARRLRGALEAVIFPAGGDHADN